MDFAEALFNLNAGRKVFRRGWNGPGQYIQKQSPGADSKMTLPYLFIYTVAGDFVPWAPSQTDVLSEDWKVLE